MNTKLNSFFFGLIILVVSVLLIKPDAIANPDKNNSGKADEFPVYNKSLGFGAGFTTGYGLSFRYTHQKCAAQINFAPYKSDYEDKVSLGITFLYNIYQSRGLNFFIYQGNHYLYEHIKNPYRFPFPMYDLQQTFHKFYNGLGIGFEFIFGERFSWNIMAGYASHENFETIAVTGETAVYFRF